jgi:bifunctional DNase/RNase
MKRGPLILIFTALCFLSYDSTLKASADSTEVKMKVKTLLIDPKSKTPVVILESTQKKEFIPIWIGKNEATSIAMELEHVKIPRPNTHDLIRNILEGLGALPRQITITDLRDNTYFAVITLNFHGQDFQIDSRPSDAIAVALRMNVPIFASSDVLAKAGQLPAPSDSTKGIRRTLGFQIQDLTRDLAAFFDLQTNGGVLVADVESGSTASRAGFQRGDVITKINGATVHNVSQLETFLETLEKPIRLRLEIQRKGRPGTVTLDLPS